MNKTDQLHVRVPVDVKAWFEAQAKDNCRTLNGEIVITLRERMARLQAEKGKPA